MNAPSESSSTRGLIVAILGCLALSACSKRSERPSATDRDAQEARPDAGSTVQPAPDPDAERRRDALREKVRTDRAGSGPALVAALDDASPLVRALAVKLIAETEHPDEAALLERMRTDPRPVVRVAVVDVLGRRGTAADLDRLLTWGPTDPDPFVRSSVFQRFVDHKDARIVPFLQRELARPESPDLSRAEVAWMLQQFVVE
jgi:HEAT repeat protein